MTNSIMNPLYVPQPQRHSRFTSESWRSRSNFLRAVFSCALVLVSGLTHTQAASPDASARKPSPVAWQEWQEGAFDQALREKKLVILDLQAQWCHWCHVMQETTYQDPEVQRLLSKHYVALFANQDARPDLSNRFRDYGWPATIIFDANAQVLAIRAGYVEPAAMRSWLAALVAQPQPEKELGQHTNAQPAQLESHGLAADVRAKLLEKHSASQDNEKGGLRTRHRFIDGDSMDYAWHMLAPNADPKQRAVHHSSTSLTLNSALKLLDPAWGGLYQYSTHSDWDHPHYEKIMSTQATGLRAYSLGLAYLHEPKYREAAWSIVRYVEKFLTSPEGAFYVSQDADLKPGEHSADYFGLGDAERRARGIPKVHQDVYSRENGWFISALCALYAVENDTALLDRAKAAGEWIEAQRSTPDGGYAHGPADPAGPYLGDTLAMGRAWLSLYSVTAERRYIVRAQRAAEYILRNFSATVAEGGGFLTAKKLPTAKLVPQQVYEENVEVARFLNLLKHYTGQERYKDPALSALSFAAQPSQALKYINGSGVLLADAELSTPPLHITVVGAKGDSKALELFQAALHYFHPYKRSEWWDKSEGPMPNPDVQYPSLPKAAAFICTDNRCSLPIFEAAKIGSTVDSFYGLVKK